jgi:hypothetical protein
MRTAYEILKISVDAEGKRLPVNKRKDKSGAYLMRYLDCAVLKYLHKQRENADLPAYDSVVGALWEGNELYDAAGITAKNHVQIRIRNPACIRGYFRVRELEGMNVNLPHWDCHPYRARLNSHCI